mmetsp:Transcript_25185/g.63925  ORF Transcript_25185/g.63925 Transcript_25185/m.63925 type:complete len:239 (+) Transcript_25185:540-1256(+)
MQIHEWSEHLNMKTRSWVKSRQMASQTSQSQSRRALQQRMLGYHQPASRQRRRHMKIAARTERRSTSGPWCSCAAQRLCQLSQSTWSRRMWGGLRAMQTRKQPTPWHTRQRGACSHRTSSLTRTTCRWASASGRSSPGRWCCQGWTRTGTSWAPAPWQAARRARAQAASRPCPSGVPWTWTQPARSASARRATTGTRSLTPRPCALRPCAPAAWATWPWQQGGWTRRQPWRRRAVWRA